MNIKELWKKFCESLVDHSPDEHEDHAATRYTAARWSERRASIVRLGEYLKQMRQAGVSFYVKVASKRYSLDVLIYDALEEIDYLDTKLMRMYEQQKKQPPSQERGENG